MVVMFNPGVYGLFCLFKVFESMLPDTLFFEASKEAFNDGVTLGRVHHGSCVIDVEASEFIPKDFGSVVASVIGSKLQVLDRSFAGGFR